MATAIVTHSCVTVQPDGPAVSADNLVRAIPKSVKDRQGWALDIVSAVEMVDQVPTAERTCGVLAVIEQESNFSSDPRVANLPTIVRKGLLEKLSPLGPLANPALKVILSGKAPGSSKTFEQRIEHLRTERDLDLFFRDVKEAYQDNLPGPYIIASALSHLLGKGGFDRLNPVTTAGSMQVKVDYAKSIKDYRGLSDAQIRDQLYTRAGGVFAGAHRLFAYEANYNDMIYRFADYNAGVYASRNAAFQNIISTLTKHTLVLDGDLMSYDTRGRQTLKETNSINAIIDYAKTYRLKEGPIRRDITLEKSIKFEDSDLWENVRTTYKEKMGKDPAYAQLPQVTLSSPKMTNQRTTAWFAKSVQRRYKRCLSAIK